MEWMRLAAVLSYGMLCFWYYAAAVGCDVNGRMGWVGMPFYCFDPFLFFKTFALRYRLNYLPT